jgi:hypothetical protein
MSKNTFPRKRREVPFTRIGSTVRGVWLLLLVIFVVVSALMILNSRARSRLERLGGKLDDPTRRFWWMRWGG